MAKTGWEMNSLGEAVKADVEAVNSALGGDAGRTRGAPIPSGGGSTTPLT